jgi:hypothetical protein
MQAIPEVLLKVLDHAQRQRRVNLARAVIAAYARRIHDLAAFGSARASGWRLWRAENGVGACGDEVGFHQRFERRVWVAAAEDCHAGVKPGGRSGLWDGALVSGVEYNYKGCCLCAYR